MFRVSGGPGVSTSTHPKRSPSGVSEGVGLKEERLSVRKPSTSTIGSRNIPTPSSPMVSSAHNPNKAEIPDRRKDMNSTTVRNKIGFVVVFKHEHLPQIKHNLIRQSLRGCSVVVKYIACLLQTARLPKKAPLPNESTEKSSHYPLTVSTLTL